MTKNKKTKLNFLTEIYNCIQGTYPDVYETKRSGNIREAKMFGEENADGRGMCYRIRKNGKIVFDQGE